MDEIVVPVELLLIFFLNWKITFKTQGNVSTCISTSYEQPKRIYEKFADGRMTPGWKP